MSTQKVKYFLTPHHDNIGDNAQAYCIRTMLSEVFGAENISEFNMLETNKGIQQVSKDDIIFMSSGGNLGDLWINGERNRRAIIQNCPYNLIVSFPQTIYFNSKEQAKVSTKIYSAHSNLHVFARDVKSYSIAKELFPLNPIEQLPDPVFTLSHIRNFKRDGILCIFRNDKEDVIKNEIKSGIVNYCKHLKFSVDVVDIEGRKENLTAFLDMISNYKLVITDRFHGAVFASITGTPCLALPTINHKIVESNFWFRKLKTETFICKDFSEFERRMSVVPKSFEYNSSLAKALYYRILFSIKENNTVPIENSIQDCIVSRRTVRSWSEDDVSKEILYDIVKSGVYAPSGSNAQCVKFRLIQDKQKIFSIGKECFRRDFDLPPVVIMVGYDFGEEKTINFSHRNKTWEPLKYQDVAVAIQNMLLYCESIGLSCCWLSFFTDKRQKFLNSIEIENNNVEYLSGLAVGFAKSKSVFETEHSNLSIKRKDIKHYLL